MLRLTIGVSCLVALVLSAGCEFWEEVTVPADDPTPPLGVARLYEVGGEGLDLFAYGPGQHISYETSDPHRTFVAIGAAWDPQGARKVRVWQGATRSCADGELGAIQNIHMLPLEAVQSGGPGDVVDTGVWNGKAINMDQADNCPGSTHLVSYTYWWSAEAENFAGEVVDGGSGSIRFVP